jgi:hypothetical protein
VTAGAHVCSFNSLLLVQLQAAQLCPRLIGSCSAEVLQQLCDAVRQGLVLVQGHSFLLGQVSAAAACGSYSLHSYVHPAAATASYVCVVVDSAGQPQAPKQKAHVLLVRCCTTYSSSC